MLHIHVLYTDRQLNYSSLLHTCLVYFSIHLPGHYNVAYTCIVYRQATQLLFSASHMLGIGS